MELKNILKRLLNENISQIKDDIIKYVKNNSYFKYEGQKNFAIRRYIQ